MSMIKKFSQLGQKLNYQVSKNGNLNETLFNFLGGVIADSPSSMLSALSVCSSISSSSGWDGALLFLNRSISAGGSPSSSWETSGLGPRSIWQWPCWVFTWSQHWMPRCSRPWAANCRGADTWRSWNEIQEPLASKTRALHMGNDAPCINNHAPCMKNCTSRNYSPLAQISAPLTQKNAAPLRFFSKVFPYILQMDLATNIPEAQEMHWRGQFWDLNIILHRKILSFWQK